MGPNTGHWPVLSRRAGQFLILEDLDYVMRAINVDSIAVIVLAYAGQTPPPPMCPPFQPLVNVVMKDGSVIPNLKVPTVSHGTPETARGAAFAFFDALRWEA